MICQKSVTRVHSRWNSLVALKFWSPIIQSRLFPFFLFFFSPPLSIFFHGWKACIDHKRARTYTWRNLDGTQHVYKIMRSTVYPGYLRNRHKFIAIALLVEFPGNRIGKHRFPFLIVEGNARSRIKLMAVSHDENSWFFTMKNKFKSAGNCVEFVRDTPRTIFGIILQIFLIFIPIFIYLYLLRSDSHRMMNTISHISTKERSFRSR